jgi:hypothetical protein
MKKLILLLALLLLPSAGFAQNGSAGTLTWTLSGGTLTVSGTGAMPDYNNGAAGITVRRPEARGRISLSESKDMYVYFEK